MIRIIRHRYTGAILHSEEAPSLGAAVEQLVARGESLARANLTDADLARADLARANLTDADLARATMPDGRTWETYAADPLAGICDEPEARERAIAAWGNHTWQNCPMHSAHGWDSLSDAPADKRLAVAAFVAVFDARLLPVPTAPFASPPAPNQ